LSCFPFPLYFHYEMDLPLGAAPRRTRHQSGIDLDEGGGLRGRRGSVQRERSHARRRGRGPPRGARLELGGAARRSHSGELGIEAYIADPVRVDELPEVGRVVLIVAHMGGGVSVGLHSYGRVVDVNKALDGDGPFSAERSGALPPGDLVRLCFSGRQGEREVLSMIAGKGGSMSLAGTNDEQLVEERARAGWIRSS
jgi:hypothetical protein